MTDKILTDTDVPGWSSRNELGLLGSLASMVPENGVIVELGSFAGRTASIMAKNAPWAKVYCIDPWGHFDLSTVPEFALTYMSGDLKTFYKGELYDIFLRNVQDCPNIIPIRGFSTEVPWDESLKVDLCFVDADHDTDPLLSDLKAWWPRMKEDGIVTGHDWQMRSIKEGLALFLEYLAEEKDYPQLLNFPTVSIWGLIKGLGHAQRWGMDFSKLYPYGDDNWRQQRPLEEVRAELEASIHNAPAGPSK